MALPVLRRKNRVEQRDGSARRPNVTTDSWSPWTDFRQLHERMGQLLTETIGQALDADLPGGGWRPPADVEETAEAYLVELELPGVRREDIAVEFGGGELAVSGEIKERERVGLLRTRTRSMGRFDYRVSLPAEVREDRISASLSDGVLTVQLPKTEAARPRRIPISSS